MGSHLGRGILAVLAALAVTLVVFRASAAEVPAMDEIDDVEEASEASSGYRTEAVYFSDVGRRLGAAAGRQVELLQKLPSDLGNALFVALPRKSGAFNSLTNVKDPRTVAIALTTDFDSLGTYVSGLLRKAA